MTFSTADIIKKFNEWLHAAEAHPHIIEPTAMCLATVAENRPSARIVLLKAVDENGFVFYSNIESRKGVELAANPNAALCFYWGPLLRQVRIVGVAARVGDAEADAYFAKRLRESQIGAWASTQSKVLESEITLTGRTAAMAKKFDKQPVPRPPHWGGWRVSPQAVEFWQEGEHRLHKREFFLRQTDGMWEKKLLYP